MSLKSILNIGIIFFLLSGCSSLVYYSIKNEPSCSDKNGYWYNNKCWKDFEDKGIPNSEIDSVVSAEMKIIEKSKIMIDDKTHPLVGFLPILEDKGYLIISVYGEKDNYKTLVFPTEIKEKDVDKGLFESTSLLFSGDALSEKIDKEKPIAKGVATINVIDPENVEIEISGKLTHTTDNKMSEFIFKSSKAILGAGNSHIEIKENEAYLSGDLGTKTYQQIKNLLKNNPQVDTIVMTHISGSVNDSVNMHTGRLLRENGLTTKVLSDGHIASGGVDLFLAGKKRIVEKGAKIGVHSWCCVNGLTAIELPKLHPAHQYQLEYFTMALGSKQGPAFYFYTLEAAEFDSVHYMSDEEIKKWNVATKFIENK